MPTESQDSLRIFSFLFTVSAVLIALFSFSIPAAAKSFDLGFSFEPNQGQADPGVKYISRGKGYTVLLKENGADLALARENGLETTVRMQLAGSNASRGILGAGKLARITNYILGNNPQNWHTGIPNYSTVEQNEIYPGIDLVYYGTRGELEYDFIVKAGADPQSIKLAFDGAGGLHIDDRGDLRLKLTDGDIMLHKPVAFQDINGKRVAVESRYALNHGQVTFELGEYDHTQRLTIDPYLTFLSPGAIVSLASGIAVDAGGNAYVTGTYGTDPASDAFIAKFDVNGNVQYLTFYGGTGSNDSLGIAIDTAGDAYIAGQTSSRDLPMATAASTATGNNSAWTPSGAPVNSYQTSLPTGATSAPFVAKFDPTGKTLLYATYLSAASGATNGTAIALDAGSNVYVTGYTSSSSFPQKNNSAIQTGNAGGNDAFVSVLSLAGNGAGDLLFSTYLGGSGTDLTRAIAVEGANVYVTGRTDGTFPAAGSAYRSAAGNGDVFVAEIANVLSSPTFASAAVLGGSGLDDAFAIGLDPVGNVFVAGQTASVNFPTMNSLQSLTGSQNAFVTVLNPNMTVLVYSTYLGGNFLDNANALFVAPSSTSNVGVAYVAGETGSGNFPLINPVQPTDQTSFNAFVSELQFDSSNLKLSLARSTTLGAGGSESANGIAVDSSGNIYVAGQTSSITANSTVFLPTVGPGITSADAATAFVSSIGSVSNTASLGALTLASTMSGGTSNAVTGTVKINRTTGSSGTVFVTLNSSDSRLTLSPSTLEFDGTTTSTNFTATATLDNFSATVTATLGNATDTQAVTVVTPAQITVFGYTTDTQLDVVAGTTTTGGVTIVPGQAVTTNITLTSSNTTLVPVANINPLVINGGLGQTSVGFSQPTGYTNTVTSVTVWANVGTATTKCSKPSPAAEPTCYPFTFNLVPPAVTTLLLSPSSLTGGSGNTSTGTVGINGVAPSAGLPVTLTSDNSNAVVPKSVTIPSGQNQVTFTITTTEPATTTIANITASLNGSAASQPLTINPATRTITGLSFSPSVVTYPGTSTGTVTIAPAVTTATTIMLTSTPAGAVPASVTISAGGTQASIPANTSVPGVYSVTATLGSSSLTVPAALTVLAPAAPQIASLALTPSTVAGGLTSQGTVLISPAQLSGTTISLTSSDSAHAGIPAFVTVSTGGTSAGFTVTTTNVSNPTTVTITASIGTLSTATANLTITPVTQTVPAGLVRHSPTLNGGNVQGSLEVLLSENFALNGNLNFNGNLLVPGTPTIAVKGHATYGGTIDGTGSASPSDKTITLNGNVTLTHAVRRSDPIAMPAVSAPPMSTGTRDVSMDGSGDADDNPGDFSTIRNLTLNGQAGQVAVPPGTYGNLTANGNSTFIFGVAGSTAAAVYNLQNLNITGNSQIQIVGPVVITLANGVNFNGSAGNPGQPSWLTLNVFKGGVALNGQAKFYGYITAPNGPVTINGNTVLYGGAAADSLTLNGGGLLDLIPQP